jgi:uncharacterized membrane protein YphA (DoxX/SURF4 family)
MPPKMEYYTYVLFRFILGGIFIWASLDKIADPVGFAEVVKNYKILPLFFVHPFALMLPWVELLCGVTLLTGHLVKGSAMLLDLLMVVFILSISINIIRGVDISCGCFSNSLVASKNMVQYLIRDIFCLFVGVWIFYYRIKQEKISDLKAI